MILFSGLFNFTRLDFREQCSVQTVIIHVYDIINSFKIECIKYYLLLTKGKNTLCTAQWANENQNHAINKNMHFLWYFDLKRHVL